MPLARAVRIDNGGADEARALVERFLDDCLCAQLVGDSLVEIGGDLAEAHAAYADAADLDFILAQLRVHHGGVSFYLPGFKHRDGPHDMKCLNQKA